jgi:hypothetical protein
VGNSSELDGSVSAAITENGRALSMFFVATHIKSFFSIDYLVAYGLPLHIQISLLLRCCQPTETSRGV